MRRLVHFICTHACEQARRLRSVAAHERRQEQQWFLARVAETMKGRFRSICAASRITPVALAGTTGG